MRTFIDHGELYVSHGNETTHTHIPRSAARFLARDVRRITARHPQERRWSWPGGSSFTIWCTKNDPWPLLIFHDRTEITPTPSELFQFVEVVEDYGKGRNR